MFSVGFIQVSLIDVGDISKAVSEDGEFGAIFSSGTELEVGVAVASIDALSLSPIALME